jgi:hypothetical protein
MNGDLGKETKKKGKENSRRISDDQRSLLTN